MNQVVNLSPNISFTTNTNNDLWQVGYSADTTLSLDQFQLCTYADTSDIIGLWHPNQNKVNGYYPYVGQNKDTIAHISPTTGWSVRGHQFAIEASNRGQYGLLRFKAPFDGQYRIKAIFEGVHFGLSTTDVHVLVNSTHLFNDFIEGYGGDSTFHIIEGAHPSTSYENLILLRKNDIITFAVGYGKNKTHYYDTTGLLVAVYLIK